MNITVSANAKLNLYLDITGRREDGYHTLETVMHTVDLRDSIVLTLKKSGISLQTDKPFIPDDGRNIAYKAAELFFTHTDIKAGIDIRITKRIPVGGGLGGSSTDGAAVLSGLNFLFGKPFSENELLSLGAKLGADVPFCIKKGAALCEGIGDSLTSLPAFSSAFALIVKPPFSFNTKEMYTAFDGEIKPASPGIEALISAVNKNDAAMASSSLFNAFYPLALRLRPGLEFVRSSMQRAGAESICMSGSGSCLFSLFGSFAECSKVQGRLADDGFEAYSTRLI